MERKKSIKSDLIYKEPLIVYKYSAEKAYIYALKIVAHLLTNPLVDKIYVEDPYKINLEILLKNDYLPKDFLNDTDSKYTAKKIQQFELNYLIPDLCIVIGGDGTTLWTNGLFANLPKPPFLNFNLGTLGYMAIYSFEKYKEVLDELYKTDKQMSVERRSTLNYEIFTSHHPSELCECSLQRDKEETKSHERTKEYQGNALNDVCIERTNNAHIVGLKILLNNEPMTIVKCDGLILSTSTGSTAYNLSAGGSVVHYDVDSLILNAICPHSLSFRPITLPRNMTIKIFPCQNSANKIWVNSDNIVKTVLKENQYVEVSLSDNYANFIVLEKFVKNRINIWIQKIVDQLGWNNAFKNVD